MGFIASSFADASTMLRSGWETFRDNALSWLQGGVVAGDLEDATVESENIVRPYIASDPLNIFDGTLQQASWRTDADPGIYWHSLSDRKDVFYNQHDKQVLLIPGMVATISTSREAPLSAINDLIVYVQADVSVGAWADCQVKENADWTRCGLFPYLAAKIRLVKKEHGADEWTQFGVSRYLTQSWRLNKRQTTHAWDFERGTQAGNGAGRNLNKFTARDKWNFSLAGSVTISTEGTHDIGVALTFDGVTSYNINKWTNNGINQQRMVAQQFTFGPRSLKIECFRST